MREVYPMFLSIGRKLYNNFREEFVDLAMDVNDIAQESYLYYLDFQKRFEHKFRKDIVWSAIRQYVIWKLMQKIYNFKTKKIQIISLDSELVDYDDPNKENKINQKLLKGKGIKTEKISPFNNEKELIKTLLKTNPKFNFDTFKKMFGEKKFSIFMEVLEGKNTLEKIGEKRKVSHQYIDKIYRKSLKRIKERFL